MKHSNTIIHINNFFTGPYLLVFKKLVYFIAMKPLYNKVLKCKYVHIKRPLFMYIKMVLLNFNEY